MREIHSHTAIRGIAAVLVVIFHYRVAPGLGFDIDAHTSFFTKSYLWVDCFFILSGFILCHVYGAAPGQSEKSRANFWWARFARIYPLHLATLLALGAWQIVLPQISKHASATETWSSFWVNLLGIHAWLFPNAYHWNFPSWSISVEFMAYLLFPLICWGLARHRMVTIGILAATIPPALAISDEHWEQTAILRGLPMFFLGVLLFQFRPDLKNETHVSIVQTSVVASLSVALHFGAPDFTIDLLFAVLITATWTDAGLSQVLRVRPLQALGDWSYSIYMLHIPIMIVMSFLLASRVPSWALLLIMVITTICAGAVSYRYFEMPVREALRRRF